MTLPKDHRSGRGAPGPSRNGDVLGYLCDIINELRDLSDKTGQRTLAAILAAALIEARIQASDHDTRSSK